jgi:pilus assembly protein TadC
MAAVSTLIDRISELAAAGILASFGGAAQALYQLYKGDKPFSIISFCTCVLLSFFVGQVVGSFIPSSLQQYHDGLLLMSGFCVFPLLDIFNAYITGLVKKLLNKVTPVDLRDKEENNDPANS